MKSVDKNVVQHCAPSEGRMDGLGRGDLSLLLTALPMGCVCECGGGVGDNRSRASPAATCGTQSCALGGEIPPPVSLVGYINGVISGVHL